MSSLSKVVPFFESIVSIVMRGGASGGSSCFHRADRSALVAPSLYRAANIQV